MARGKVSNDTIEFILKANGLQLQEEIQPANRQYNGESPPIN